MLLPRNFSCHIGTFEATTLSDSAWRCRHRPLMSRLYSGCRAEIRPISCRPTSHPEVRSTLRCAWRYALRSLTATFSLSPSGLACRRPPRRYASKNCDSFRTDGHGMRTIRKEPWGRIVYEPVLDEFEAQVRGNDRSLTIDRPISAGCLVTRRCDLKCQYCYGNDESLPKAELSASEWAGVFRRLKSWGLMRVDLSGGEPTIRSDIGEIATAALDADLNVVVSTNGSLLAKKGLTILPDAVRLHVSLDSGFAGVHESSRVRRDMRPSVGSFAQTLAVVMDAVGAGYRVRVLTCIGRHNGGRLVELGERLALADVDEWNISRVLAAGRARFASNDRNRWAVDEEAVFEEIDAMRRSYPWMHIRYSNRTTQDGYFLLVLPDGTVATQYTDDRDKVVLGHVDAMTVEDLRAHPAFDLTAHARKWIAATPAWVGAGTGEGEGPRRSVEFGDTGEGGAVVG